MKTLIIVDVQNDFLPGGSLAVPNGNEIISIINGLIPKYDLVIATKDYHPRDHKSFASQHKNYKPGDTVILNGIRQILWPDHCIQNTYGSDIAKSLNSSNVDHIIYKGTNKEIDSYSAFFDNNHQNTTGLHEYLQNKKIQNLDIVGLATDYCVKYTVLDALELEYNVRVITSACKGIDLTPGDIKKSLEEMKTKGAIII
ncbi:MAG: bifunctional nicotinamidase/pyrazinamidase [Rickettsiales bacterium]|nr:bifunctional nicotinamidase/pyrazinamidase [Rickettsiales bacterium]